MALKRKIGLSILQEFLDNTKQQDNEFLNSRNYLNEQSLQTALYPRDSKLILKGYREGLLVKTAEHPKCLLIDALENKDKSDDQICSQFSILHEALFWTIGQNKHDLPNDYAKKALVDNQNALESKHAELLKRVYEIECKILTNLEEQRNKFCNKLSEKMNWKQMLINVYCQMTKDLLLDMTAEEEIGFDEVYGILEKIGFAKHADQKTTNIAHIARAYAFLFEYLEKDGDEGALSFEFVSTLNKFVEGIDKHQVNKKSDLLNFLAWVDSNLKSRAIDTVTLATIAHCGVIKMQAFREGNHRTALLVQNYVLMKSNYPAMAIGAEDIKEFKKIFDNGKPKRGNWYLRGCDISPSMRFLFECMDKTMNGLLKSMSSPVAEQSQGKKKVEAGKVATAGGSKAEPEEESTKKKKIEGGKLAAAGGSGGLDEEEEGLQQMRASPTGTGTYFGPCSPMQFDETLEEDENVDKSITTKEPGAKRMKLTQTENEGPLVVAQTPSPSPPPPYVQFGSLIKEALLDFNEHLLEYPKDLVVKEPIADEELLKKWGLLSGQ